MESSLGVALQQFVGEHGIRSHVRPFVADCLHRSKLLEHISAKGTSHGRWAILKAHFATDIADSDLDGFGPALPCNVDMFFFDVLANAISVIHTESNYKVTIPSKLAVQTAGVGRGLSSGEQFDVMPTSTGGSPRTPLLVRRAYRQFGHLQAVFPNTSPALEYGPVN